MIEKRVVVNQIEVTTEGLGIRFALEVVEDGEAISQKWHRTVVPFAVNPSAQLGFVSQHLVSMGYPELAPGQIATVQAIFDVALLNPLG